MAAQDPILQVGKTPQDQFGIETPRISAPAVQHQFQGSYGYFLGDSERRYGRLRLARRLPTHTKLEMLRDPVIAMAQGFISASLVKARRAIECVDEDKRRFFEAMFRSWEREFILQAAQAVSLGSCGLIKRFAFQVPEPVEIDEPPVWTAAAVPYIVRGFDAVYPLGSFPRFDNKGRIFQGMDTSDGRVDVFFSLWITIGQARAFGAYGGSGRLENVYRDWWAKQFGRDLYLVWLQKQINPATKAGYPPGKTSSGKAHQDIALAVGDSVRSGSTVALPTTVYSIVDQMTGDERLSAVQQWTLDFLESSRSVGQFHEVDDHHDQKMSLGMLLPPQMYLNVKQSALGGPTTADVLTKLAEDLLLIDAADIDRHVNEYVFPAVARANFPPDSPPVRVRTVGLAPESRTQLFEIVRSLLGRMDIDPSAVDMREALDRLGIPLLERGAVPPPPPPEEEEIEEEAVAAQAGEDGAPAEAAIQNPPPEVLQRMIEDTLDPVPPVGEIIPDAEYIERAFRRLKAALPEVFEDEEEE
jgi:hypothetical protein